MAQDTPLRPESAPLLQLPGPVPDWGAQILEYLYLLGATLWLGVHATTALLTAPLLTKTSSASLEVARLLIRLLEMLGWVATIAATILMLATIGMYRLRLRAGITILAQLVLLLLMTAVAVIPQLWIVPKLSALLSAAAVSAETVTPQATTVLVGATGAMGAMGTLHLILGSVLVAMGTRRAYRYPQEELSSLSPADGL